jgi:hypothetical protein
MARQRRDQGKRQQAPTIFLLQFMAVSPKEPCLTSWRDSGARGARAGEVAGRRTHGHVVRVERGESRGAFRAVDAFVCMKPVGRGLAEFTHSHARPR